MMTLPELCERIQSALISRAISESTWGYPIVGALHVLAIALFGGAVLTPHLPALGFPLDLAVEFRRSRRVGLALILATGVLLFGSGAASYYESTFFRIKMLLLALLVLNALAARTGHRKTHAAIALVLWAAVIFAARGIAFL